MHPPGKVLAAAGLIACCCGAALVLLGAGTGAPRPLAAAPALALEKAGGPPMLGGAYVAAVQDLAQSYLFRGLDSTTHTELAAVALTGEVLAADDAEASLLFRAYSDFGLLAEQLGVLFDPSLVARVDSTSADLRAKAAFVNTLALGPDCVVVVAHSRLARHFGVRSVRLRSDVAIMGDTDVNEYARRYGDSYISAATSGAEYVAALVCRNVTLAQRAFITAKLNIAVAQAWADPTIGSAAAGSQRVSGAYGVNCFLKEAAFGTASGDSGKPSESLDAVGPRAYTFSAAKVSAPTLLGLEHATYETVGARPLAATLAQVLANRQFSNEALQLAVDLAALRARLLRIYQAYDAYGAGASDGSLSRIWEGLDAVDDGARKLRGWQAAFDADVATQAAKPDLTALLRKPAPAVCATLAYSTEAVGTRPGGQLFDDRAALAASPWRTLAEAMLAGVRLSAFEARTDGATIAGLQTFWQTANGTKLASPLHGVARGKKARYESGLLGGGLNPIRAARYGVDAAGALCCLELYTGQARGDRDDLPAVAVGNCGGADRKAWFERSGAAGGGGTAVALGFAGFFDPDARGGGLTRLQLVYGVLNAFAWDWDPTKCERTI